MTFQEQVKTELHELARLGACSKQKSLRACAKVDACNEVFNELSDLSVTDAASLALELIS